MSNLRDEIHTTMEGYRTFLEPDGKGWKVMEVGIDGDERPGGNYKLFAKGNTYKTLDFLSRLEPDIVADICDTKLPPEEWDLIIFSQTIEHIPQPLKAITECYRLLKKGGYLILDCPFNYPYHTMPEYDDYWRFTHRGLKQVLEDNGFKVLSTNVYGEVLSSALALK